MSKESTTSNISSSQQKHRGGAERNKRFIIVTSLSLFVLSLAYFISVTKPNLLNHIYQANLPAFFTTLSSSSSSQTSNNINTNQQKSASSKDETTDEMAASNESWKNAKNVYEFEAKDIDGNVIQLSKYK